MNNLLTHASARKRSRMPLSFRHDEACTCSLSRYLEVSPTRCSNERDYLGARGTSSYAVFAKRTQQLSSNQLLRIWQAQARLCIERHLDRLFSPRPCAEGYYQTNPLSSLTSATWVFEEAQKRTKGSSSFSSTTLFEAPESAFLTVHHSPGSNRYPIQGSVTM
jgi:hypothetical protein